MIEVAGFHHRGPLLRFLGKCDMVCDLVGEKLAEEHMLASVTGRMSVDFQFPVVRPGPGPKRESASLSSLCAGLRWPGESIAAELQAGLEENPYYRHAVAMGSWQRWRWCCSKTEHQPGRFTSVAAWNVAKSVGTSSRACWIAGPVAGTLRTAAVASAVSEGRYTSDNLPSQAESIPSPRP